jgi:hypothetical protein
MNLPRAVASVAVAASFLAVACGDVVSQPIGAAPVTDAAAPDVADAPTPADARADAPTDAPADAPAFCSGTGPIAVPGTSFCLGDLTSVFRFAACACDSLAVSGTLTVDIAPSAGDAGAAKGDVASIAANGAVSTNAQTNVLGSIWAGGAGAQGAPAVTLRDFGLVAQDVQSGAGIEIGGSYIVGGNLWANGDVTLDTGASLTVQGTVHIPSGDTATGVQGTVVNGPVQVGAPCDCSNPTDIGAVVDAFANYNDDASRGFSASTTLDGNVTLPCGRYYVAAVAGTDVALQITGRVALLVDGDVNVTHSLTVTLTPGAELDLAVKGGFSVMGSLAIGDTAHAAHTRLYVGGTTFSLSATVMPLAAAVYAPKATLQLASDLQMVGALFAQSMQFSGAFDLSYDPSVLDVTGSSGCEPSGKSCNTCNDCPAATPACKSGTCAPCVTTADCCAPLECDIGSGQCVLANQ